MRKLLLIVVVLLTAQCMRAQNTGIMPTPQRVEPHDGVFTWDSLSVAIDDRCADKRLILSQYEELTGKAATIAGKKQSSRRIIRLQKVKRMEGIPCHSAQAYHIDITPDAITVSATTDQGLFYGWQSVRQLYRYHYRLYFEKDEHVTIPCMSITDYPLLEWRGWMNDLSRGPISTTEFIKRQIRILSEYKLNCLSLYTENVFSSEHFHYAPADALTAAEIREIDSFARLYHVELVGNQQCFAHFEKILAHPDYAHLADTKYNLNPAIPETYEFLETLLTDEARAYSSPWFNINCDETESLGSGAAAEYVKSVGAAEAYSRHILQVDEMMKRLHKRTMMWADIVLKDAQIAERLPKDITMLVWSYVPSEEFRSMTEPVSKAGFDFWVVPGTSMWSTVFPDMRSYEKNIANFARDGYQTGAKGLLNTCWNDSGEALLNSAWHALGWGAEMAWKPIVSTEHDAAEAERAARLAIFDTCFNFQFFHFYNNENIIADFLRAASDLSTASVGEIYNMGSLWRYQPLCFLPGNLTEEELANVKDERFHTTKIIELEKLILSEEEQYQNPEIIYCALHAANRVLNNLMLKRSQFYLYHDYQHPEAVTQEEVTNVENEILDFTYFIGELKKSYDYLRDLEYRPYWKEQVDAMYDKLSQSISEIPQHVFINTSISEEGETVVDMSTLLGGYPIHYTTDGSIPTTSSPTYFHPFVIAQTSTIKTVTRNSNGREVFDEKEILVHKGLGRCKEVKGDYSTYRPEYSGGGKLALSDGITGSTDYRDGKWQGYQGQDVTLSYRFPGNTLEQIHQISVRYLQNFYDWIMAPQEVVISYRNGDGQEQTVLPTYHFDIDQITGSRIGTLEIGDLDIRCTTLTITIKNPGPLPHPHGAAGAPSYIFLDEVILH